MIFLLITSILLIWLHAYNLKFMIKTGNDPGSIQDIKKLDHMPEVEKNISFKSFSLILSLAVIMVINLMEIGYFIYSNYFFNDLIVTIGSAVLVGYTLYSVVKFFSKIRNFMSKPFNYLMSRNKGLESVLNYIIVPLEIVFCSYIIIKIFIKFIILG